MVEYPSLKTSFIFFFHKNFIKHEESIFPNNLMDFSISSNFSGKSKPNRYLRLTVNWS